MPSGVFFFFFFLVNFRWWIRFRVFRCHTHPGSGQTRRIIRGELSCSERWYPVCNYVREHACVRTAYLYVPFLFFFTGMRFVRTLRQINRTTQWSSRRSFVCYCYFFYRADCDVRLGTELTFCENVTRCVMLKILSSLLIFAPETKPTCRHLVIFFSF